MSVFFSRKPGIILVIAGLSAISCVNPIFVDKGCQGIEIKPNIVFIPAAYYGRFNSYQEQSENNLKNIYTVETKFSAWENFNVNVEDLINAEFAEIAAEINYVNNEQVLKALEGLIAVDSSKSAFKKFLNLQDIFGDQYPTLMDALPGNFLIVFTDLTLRRAYVEMDAIVKYRIYDIRSGDLILANKFSKKYRIKWSDEIKREIKNQLLDGKTPDRFLGLHEDEIPAYCETCRRLVELVKKDIKKYLLKY